MLLVFLVFNSIFLLLSLPWSGVDFVPCFLIRLCFPRSVKSVSSLVVGLVFWCWSRLCSPRSEKSVSFLGVDFVPSEPSRGCFSWSEPLSITASKVSRQFGFLSNLVHFLFPKFGQSYCLWLNQFRFSRREKKCCGNHNVLSVSEWQVIGIFHQKTGVKIRYFLKFSHVV